MAGWLAFNPREGGHERFADACRWIETVPGLPRVAEADGVAVFGARAHGAAQLVQAEGAWLAICGTWRHPAGDAQAVLQGLLGRGAAFVDDMQGHFALAWFDPRDDSLEVANDRFGRWHVFSAETPNGPVFGTSAIALARVAGAEPDPLGIAEFFSCGTYFEERTPFAKVRRVFKYARDIVAGGDEPADAALVGRRVGEAIRAEVEHLDRWLPDLTGGLDSRLVVGFLAAQGPVPDVTVTGSAGTPDVAAATRLAERVGSSMHRIDPGTMVDAKSSFPEVLDAASLAEGCYDSVEYVGIARIHLAHAKQWGASVNGSGGEMYRNYWWDRSDLGRKIDPVARALPRFTRGAMSPTLLAEPHRLDPQAHFRAVLDRGCEPVRDLDAWRQLDHLYLALRMQFWQGSIAGATNRIWPAVSPLFESAPLRAVYNAPPEIRLGSRLFFSIIATFSEPFRNLPLESGFPPQPLSVANAWRFLPGLARLPGDFAGRVRRRLFPTAETNPAAERIVQGLRHTGLNDWLDPQAMALAPLLDDKQFAALRDGPRPPLAVLGRLIATEFALREAARPLTG
ncbi:MAG: asparagine synthetase B family protein [Planctomycetota bacterium]